MATVVMSTIQHVVRNMDALLPSRIWSSEDGLREFVNSVSDFAITRVLLTYDSEEEEEGDTCSLLTRSVSKM